MYFLNLKAFHPTVGVNTNNNSKYPFLQSTDSLLGPDDFHFNFDSSFLSDKIELNEGQQFYVSEPNLLKVFKNTLPADNKIPVNNIKPIEEAYTKELAGLFYNGYTTGSAQFYEEIDQAFLSLELEQKKQSFRDFISYCYANLYLKALPFLKYYMH
ncbi:hypothetical protein [Mucilaginibacter sp. UYCu711]|uniref:hypothetical protein n=1 Tax=Mucilaginibacter sp. UYCu711 TaxID=3156339 RepID=UPI003D1CCD2B